MTSECTELLIFAVTTKTGQSVAHNRHVLNIDLDFVFNQNIEVFLRHIFRLQI